MSWFDEFKNSMHGEATPSDLIGAGKADAQKALEHYRYQHEQKIKEAVEDTFPILLERLGGRWKNIWKEFWSTNPRSPRSLDFYADVFLEYFQKSSATVADKELCRFERILDTYPWKTTPVIPCSLENLSGESILELGDHEIISFKAQVISLYQGEEVQDESTQVIFWLTQDGVEFKNLATWEVEILKNLGKGIDEALETIEQDADEVSGFFSWLARSGLIRKLH